MLKIILIYLGMLLKEVRYLRVILKKIENKVDYIR